MKVDQFLINSIPIKGIEQNIYIEKRGIKKFIRDFYLNNIIYKFYLVSSTSG